MKRQENMSMSDMVNFDRDVVNYINDNLQHIKENAAASENDNLAKEALEHYSNTVEAFNETDETLSAEQQERFLNVAKRLFSQGYVEHGGILDED